jgi:hypothetical protein
MYYQDVLPGEDAMLNNLSFSQFKAYFRVEDPITLPQYTGTVLHDALGCAFWKVRYGMKETCPECSIRSACRYQNLRAYFFKSPSDHPFIKPVHDELYRRMQRDEYPQPFVFDPITGGHYEAGQFLAFSFALIGKAIECFPFMACALSLVSGHDLGLGNRRITLEAIGDGFPADDASKTLIYDAATGQIHGPCQVIDFDCVRQWVLENTSPNETASGICIRFWTPFRYKSNGKLGVPLTFEILMRNLLRRFTLLSVHSPLTSDMDHQHLLALAKDVKKESSSLKWDQLRRHSFTQKESMNLDGYLGDITFSGDLDIFLPYLRMGELLNVGKAASFGHGKYTFLILQQ